MTKILFALTGAETWVMKDGEEHYGGVWSPEFVYPYDAFSGHEYEITVGTIGGVPAPIDPASLELTLQENDQSSVDFQREYIQRPAIEDALAHPVSLESIDPADFDAVFVPGGFGVYEDLGDNPVMGGIVTSVFERDGVVATLCSGASALLGAKAKDGSWPFVGRQITGFPNSEMSDFGVAESAHWLPEDRLLQVGADYRQGQKHTEHVVVDGNLISGQNGASSKRTAAAVITHLERVLA